MDVVVYRNNKMIGRMCEQDAMDIVGCDPNVLGLMANDGLSMNGYYCVKVDMSMDMMYDMQATLQRRLNVNAFGDARAKTQYIKHHAQYLDQELHEMMRELPYFKEWKQYDWTPDELHKHLEAAKDEFVDVFHFMLNIAIALGLTPSEIAKRYVDKNVVNHTRQDTNY